MSQQAHDMAPVPPGVRRPSKFATTSPPTRTTRFYRTKTCVIGVSSKTSTRRKNRACSKFRPKFQVGQAMFNAAQLSQENVVATFTLLVITVVLIIVGFEVFLRKLLTY